MPDFNVRSDSVNVEQIMEQIRARIREKRGVDYTEQQIHELAKVKLEKFLDPRTVRSDLLDQFRRLQPAYEPPELPNYAFGETTLFESHRAPIRFIRRLLMPLLKLFFNPNPLIQALHIQSRLNTLYAEREAKREAMRLAGEQLYYELLHNLVVEMTRTGIEVKNLKMRIESLSSRLEFNERRARALEGVVAYKSTTDEGVDRTPRAAPSPPPPQPTPVRAPSAPPPSVTVAPSVATTPAGQPPEGPGQRSRRRRRRRGRRSGGSAAALMGPQQAQPGATGAPLEAGPPVEAAARDDLQTFTGAESHPSEPEVPGPGPAVETREPDNPPADRPPDIDPDTQ